MPKYKLSSLLIICLLISGISFSQDTAEGKEGGQFSLGVRNTNSFFTDAGSPGVGFGGQFRIRMGKRINTDWFADYITTNIQSLGLRRDGHIGWSVLFYLNKHPLMEKKISPYFVAGHCFDFTKVTSLSSSVVARERWSSAVQMGFGAHYNVTERFDITLLTQYMNHFGTDIHTDIETDASGKKFLAIQQRRGSVGLEGHLLTTISLNYRIADLW